MGDQHPGVPPAPPPPGTTVTQPPPAQSDPPAPPPPPPPSFDPSRRIIKRKALIKKLAALYHAECLSYSQQLLELQNNSQEPFVDLKAPDDTKKETAKTTKRAKKSR